MPSSQYSLLTQLPITVKPLIPPDNIKLYQDIFNLQNSVRILASNGGGSVQEAANPTWVLPEGLELPGLFYKFGEITIDGELYYIPLYKTGHPVPDDHLSSVALIAPFVLDFAEYVSGVDFSVTGNAKISNGAAAVSSGNLTHALTALGNSAFTLELFVAPVDGGAGVSYGRIIQIGNTGTAGALTINRVASDNPSGILVQVYNGTWGGGGAANLNGSATKLPNSVFTHVAVTRSATEDWNLWVNGANAASVSGATAVALSGTSIFVGRNNSGGEQWNGAVKWLRLTVGVVRYTTAFTPPSAPLELPTP